MYVLDLLSIITILFIKTAFLIIILRNKRLILGLKKAFVVSEMNLYLHFCVDILFLKILFDLNNGANPIYIVPIICTFFLGTTLYFLFKNKITSLYMDGQKARELYELTLKLEHLKQDNDSMSKQIHKDNKIIPVMQVAFYELYRLIDATPQLTELQSQLDILTKERFQFDTIDQEILLSCNRPSTSAVLRYYSYKAKEQNINLELHISDEALSFIPIPIDEFNILICDLMENAIISLRSIDEKNIRLIIELKESAIYICICDSGIPFSENVIQKMGKERITTYGDSGGSGIGLLSIYKILKKISGTFEVEPLKPPSKFTKQINISLLFDK